MKMTINKCNIIKDLLPLYTENMASDDSKSFIEEHLAGCNDCKAEYEKLIRNDHIQCNQCGDEGEVSVLKRVKKKMVLKRIFLVVASILLTIAAIVVFSCTRAVNIDYGVSEKYSSEEMKDAVNIIIEKMDSMEGCVLYSITYRGDDFCERELEYCNTLADKEKGEVFVDCIVFTTDFRSPLFGGGAWSANRIYHWTWYLARTEGGPWILLTWGLP